MPRPLPLGGLTTRARNLRAGAAWRPAARALMTTAVAGSVLLTGMPTATAAPGTVVTSTTASATSGVASTAADAFGRTVTSGWGTADRGGAWTTSGSPVTHSVAAGAARQRVGAKGITGWARLGGVTTTDADLRLDVALDKAATGGGTYLHVIGRRVGTAGDYRARLKVQSSGTVALSVARGGSMLKTVNVPGVRYTAGTKLSVRLQVTGTFPTTIRAKAWKAGTTEPTAWQTTTTDATAALQKPGSIATGTYLSGSTTNAPVTATWSRLSLTGTVPVNVAPTASAGARVDGLRAVLDGSASTDSDGSVTGYRWDLGDGTSTTGRTAEHTYASPGSYTVRLTVTDDDGAIGTTSTQVVAVRPNQAPVAGFTTAKTGLTVSADAASSSDPDGTIAGYAWQFGDGTTATGRTARHTYAATGTYTVALTVTDDSGARTTTTSTVSVTAPAPAPAPSPVSAPVQDLSRPAAPGTVEAGPGNTGVPAGTTLRIHHGDLHVTTPGAVIDAMDIRGLVKIKAPGVTIKRSIIRGRPITGDNALIMNDHGTYSFTLQDSELIPSHPSYYISGIIGANFTVDRTNIHGVIDQIHITGNDVTVRNSWLHDNLHYAVDPHHKDGSHDDNIQIQAGHNITITGNTMTGSYNAALQITQDRSTVRNLTYTHNRVDNGGCTLNIAEKTRGPMTGLVFTDNTFGKNSRHGCSVIHPPTSPITFARNLHTDGTPLKMVTR